MTLRELIPCAAIASFVGILSAEAAAPYAFTQPHWAVTSTLNGMAGPNGLPSTAWFEWGETTAYGQTTAPVDVGVSSSVVKVSATLSNLVAGQIYHARMVVSNAAGVAFGMDEQLITAGRMKVSLLGVARCGEFPRPIPRPICIPPDACNDGHWFPPRLVPPGISDIVGISAGGLVLRSDGVAFRSGVPVLSNIVAMVGANPDLGLHPDGTVTASDGNVPTGLSDVVTIARGGRYSMALRCDGTVAAWGDPTGPTLATNVPPGLSNVVAIAAGSSYALALRIDGTVVAWGDESGLTNVPPGLTNVVAVTAGNYSSAAVRRDGTVVAWPDMPLNSVSNLRNVVAMFMGETTLALHRDGTITEIGSDWGTYWRRDLFSNVVTICAGFALGPNQAPLGYTVSFACPQNQDSIVSLQAFDANGDALRFRIATVPRTGALYQFQNGGRGSPILVAETLVTDPEQRVIFALAADDSDLELHFAFVANDGELDSAPIAVALSLPPPAFPRIRMGPRDPCSAIVQFVGNTNQTYRVWASTNLLDWQVLGSALSWGSSVFSFTDYQAKVPARFYKVSTP